MSYGEDLNYIRDLITFEEEEFGDIQEKNNETIISDIQKGIKLLRNEMKKLERIRDDLPLKI